jgi:hypothetical protein
MPFGMGPGPERQSFDRMTGFTGCGLSAVASDDSSLSSLCPPSVAYRNSRAGRLSALRYPVHPVILSIPLVFPLRIPSRAPACRQSEPRRGDRIGQSQIANRKSKIPDRSSCTVELRPALLDHPSIHRRSGKSKIANLKSKMPIFMIFQRAVGHRCCRRHQPRH